MATADGSKISKFADPSTSFFVMKCADLESLDRCIVSGKWAYRERDKEPQPHEMLTEAHKNGKVVLVCSVNGQHGWHGFCESNFDPQLHCPESIAGHNIAFDFNNEGENDKMVRAFLRSAKSELKPWYCFPVRWQIYPLLCCKKQSCLDFKGTENLKLPDGSSVNKAKNWQQVPHDVGWQLCQMIEDYFTQLIEKEIEEGLQKQQESFVKNIGYSASCQEFDVWCTVIQKVERELGPVHLACPFGSQRYNCNTAESDLDIFIVYQAKTTAILSLDQPQQTIKNSHHETVDYTVLELHRYCELLLKGDAKCVETLFLCDSPNVVRATPVWKKFCENRKLALTEHCLDKYLKEIHGTTGLKQFDRWRRTNSETEQLTPKLTKLGYIVLRLLQSTRDMVKDRDIQVYRPDTSQERQELMSMRAGEISYSQFMALVNKYMGEIEMNKSNIVSSSEEFKSKVNDWLFRCRMFNLRSDPLYYDNFSI